MKAGWIQILIESLYVCTWENLYLETFKNNTDKRIKYPIFVVILNKSLKITGI